MAYYGTGDYYRGDYYRGRGDLFGGLLNIGSSILKKVVGATPVGIAAGALGGVLKPPSTLPQGGIPLPGPYRIHPTKILPGGAPFITRDQSAPMAGYHLDKKHHSRWVRNRSMNPANPRALRRAVRREHAFVALARRVLKGTGISIGRRSFGRKSTRKR